jgi:hypothetical protein
LNGLGNQQTMNNQTNQLSYGNHTSQTQMNGFSNPNGGLIITMLGANGGPSTQTLQATNLARWSSNISQPYHTQIPTGPINQTGLPLGKYFFEPGL